MNFEQKFKCLELSSITYSKTYHVYFSLPGVLTELDFQGFPYLPLGVESAEQITFSKSSGYVLGWYRPAL